MTPSKERPILFSAQMVRALLAGTKTQTRRAVKPQPDHFIGGPGVTDAAGNPWPREPAIDEQSCSLVIRCPYGQPGDRLWVREAWSHDASSDEQCRAAHEDMMGGGAYGPYYRATEVAPDTLRWRPSIHMPRWASRITLEIAGVRVERLQDISEADAIAEGIERGVGFPGWYRYPLPGDSEGLAESGRLGKVPTAFPKLAYRALWESINGPGSWDANPWVWVVEFKTVKT